VEKAFNRTLALRGAEPIRGMRLRDLRTRNPAAVFELVAGAPAPSMSGDERRQSVTARGLRCEPTCRPPIS